MSDPAEQHAARVVAIETALLDHILALAAASPDEEVCGLLLGNGHLIDAIAPAANVAPDRARAFEVDPAILFAAHRAARAGGPPIVGHYHSHPSGIARPSAHDLAAAAAGQLWLITAAGGARLWRANGRGFDEVVLRAI